MRGLRSAPPHPMSAPPSAAPPCLAPHGSPHPCPASLFSYPAERQPAGWCTEWGVCEPVGPREPLYRAWYGTRSRRAATPPCALLRANSRHLHPRTRCSEPHPSQSPCPSIHSSIHVFPQDNNRLTKVPEALTGLSSLQQLYLVRGSPAPCFRSPSIYYSAVALAVCRTDLGRTIVFHPPTCSAAKQPTHKRPRRGVCRPYGPARAVLGAWRARRPFAPATNAARVRILGGLFLPLPPLVPRMNPPQPLRVPSTPSPPAAGPQSARER